MYDFNPAPDLPPRPHPFRYERLAPALAAFFGLCWWISGRAREMQLPGAYEAGGIVLLMLAAVAACMLTERGEWPVWKRIAFVPAAFIAHTAICVQLAYEATFLTWTPVHMFQGGTALAASLPIVAYAMWRSRLFVKSVGGKLPHAGT